MSDKQSSQLIFLGVLLFLIGLTSGLIVPAMGNPRMGLAAHLEATMNGMFLMLLGVIWARIEISDSLKRITFWLALYGTFANFIAIQLAAITGAGAMLPLAGGKEGAAPVEMLITFLLISLSAAMIAMCFLVLIGLRNHMNKS